VIDPTGGPGQAGQSDPSVVVDGGVARPVLYTSTSGALAGTAIALVGASPGIKTKVLALSMICAAFTTAGSAYFTGGVSPVYWIGRFGALNTNVWLDLGGIVICSTAANTALNIHFDGSATFGMAITYYQAP